MRKLLAVLLLLCSVHAMAQVKVEQQSNDKKIAKDSVMADTTSYFTRSIMQNKTALRISEQEAKRYNRKFLPSSSQPIFQDEGQKRLKQRNMNANGDILTNIGDLLINSIRK